MFLQNILDQHYIEYARKLFALIKIESKIKLVSTPTHVKNPYYAWHKNAKKLK